MLSPNKYAGPLIHFNYSCQCLLIFLKVYLWGISRNYVSGLLLNIPFNLGTLQLESRGHMIVCPGHTLVSCGHALVSNGHVINIYLHVPFMLP
jgi:hypothetical protein